jgi:hypothetical protein
MHYMGTNLVFRGNYIHHSPLVVYQVSPDVFENFSPVQYQGILFTKNFVEGFAGVLSSQKGTSGEGGPLEFTHNVFVDVGSLSIRYPESRFVNNTFVNVSAKSNPVASALRHPITFEANHTGYALVKNNIFVGCGEGRDPDLIGWYEFLGDPTNATVGPNFVAGPAPDFSSKAGFAEGQPNLNGGDPGFIDIADPLGPDGLPFTDDDGLRLRADSKLRGAGEGGVDLGAYNTAEPAPLLAIALQADGQLRLTWPIGASAYALESADALDAQWAEVTTAPVIEGEWYVVTLQADQPTTYFRLRL